MVPKTGYRHRYDHRIDVVDQIADTTCLEQKVDAQRHYHEAEKQRIMYTLGLPIISPDGQFCH